MFCRSSDSDADSDDESISALKDDSDSDDETGVTIRHGRRRLPWRSKVYSLNRSFQGAAIRDAVTHTAAHSLTTVCACC